MYDSFTHPISEQLSNQSARKHDLFLIEARVIAAPTNACAHSPKHMPNVIALNFNLHDHVGANVDTDIAIAVAMEFIKLLLAGVVLTISLLVLIMKYGQILPR